MVEIKINIFGTWKRWNCTQLLLSIYRHWLYSPDILTVKSWTSWSKSFVRQMFRSIILYALKSSINLGNFSTNIKFHRVREEFVNWRYRTYVVLNLESYHTVLNIVPLVCKIIDFTGKMHSLSLSVECNSVQEQETTAVVELMACNSIRAGLTIRGPHTNARWGNSSPFSSLSFPLPLEVGPLNPAREFGGAVSCPAASGAEPSRNRFFGAF